MGRSVEISELDMMEIFYEQLDGDAARVRQMAVKEYATQEEPYYNFTVRSQFLGLPVRDVLLSDLMKHVVSICRGVSLREPMRGRVIDALNLLRLLAYWDDAQPDAVTEADLARGEHMRDKGDLFGDTPI